MFADTLAAFGRLDVLINNAGWQKQAPSDQVEMADYDGVMNTNIRGAFMCSGKLYGIFSPAAEAA